ncbi:hypothetical protein JK364_50060 [Streptomyces sp. 110]|uniref:Uncharacterized protein n=1 Tax=Streptomyces endocoffeicus TaxID=2898945 RepID=A0ABS1Q7Y5_9ACTN|nr:hypothetical protein [Streptomyces endocoffeicus]MBL1120385.1 hypothetical protein [Streptomyces endocoffeicus]
MHDTRNVETSKVLIRIDSADTVDEQVALVAWLRAERGLHGRVHVTHTAPTENELGTAFDLLVVSLGSGGVATVLAGSLSAWLQNRRAQTTIRITVTRADRTLELETGDAAEAEALIRRFLGDDINGA